MPAPYVNFLEAFSFMTLDMVRFVPFECMYTESSFDHLEALLIETLSPLVLLAAAYGVVLVQQHRHQGAATNKSSHIFSNFMHMLFFVLPIISR